MLDNLEEQKRVLKNEDNQRKKGKRDNFGDNENTRKKERSCN